MTRRDILREEVKRLKELFKIDINLGKLDSIKECRDAINKIYQEKYKIQQLKQNANSLSELYIVERMRKVEEENKALKEKCNILVGKLNNPSTKKGLFSFLK